MTTTTPARTRELTDWFPAEVKPVHEGTYETRIFFGEPATFQYWTGSYWSHSDITPYRAELATLWHGPGAFQNVEWRGLKEQAC